MAFLVMLPGSHLAQAEQATRELEKSLAQKASGRWRDAPVGPTLERLSDTFSTPIWIDRRVDPLTPLTLVSKQQSLAATIDGVAKAIGFQATATDRIVYVGPERSAAALPTLTSAWRRTSTSRMKRRGVTTWPRLSQPQAIAEELTRESGYRLVNAEAIPHDLWPAGSTPTLALGDRLTLVLIGFDLRWRVDQSDPKAIRVEAIDYRTLPKQTATLTSIAGEEKPNQAGVQRYTLRVVQQPFGSVMAQLAKQLGRQLQVDPEVEAMRSQRISFQVENVSLEAMIEAIGKAAEVSIVVSDETLEIRSLDFPSPSKTQ